LNPDGSGRETRSTGALYCVRPERQQARGR
jgi:hypothetical protein